MVVVGAATEAGEEAKMTELATTVEKKATCHLIARKAAEAEVADETTATIGMIEMIEATMVEMAVMTIEKHHENTDLKKEGRKVF